MNTTEPKLPMSRDDKMFTAVMIYVGVIIVAGLGLIVHYANYLMS